MNLIRVYGDAEGETHLSRLEMPEAAASDDGFNTLRRRVLGGIPTTTMNVNQNLERRPKLDLHPAPRRQWVILLQGEFEVTTTAGDSYRFRPGDCLLADDLGSKGHTHEDVGAESSITITVGVADDWAVPGT